jgi:hypothetical protein
VALSRNYLENVQKISRLCQHFQTDSQQEQIMAASATTLTEAQVEALTTRVQHALDMIWPYHLKMSGCGSMR